MTPDHHSQQGFYPCSDEIGNCYTSRTNIQQVQTVVGYMERHELHNSRKERMDVVERETNGGVRVRVWSRCAVRRGFTVQYVQRRFSRPSSPLPPFSPIPPRIFSGTSLRDPRAFGPSTTRSQPRSGDRPPFRCSDPTFPSRPLSHSPAN